MEKVIVRIRGDLGSHLQSGGNEERFVDHRRESGKEVKRTEKGERGDRMGRDVSSSSRRWGRTEAEIGA